MQTLHLCALIFNHQLQIDTKTIRVLSALLHVNIFNSTAALTYLTSFDCDHNLMTKIAFSDCKALKMAK